jgi:protein-tyrosine phosphatase
MADYNFVTTRLATGAALSSDADVQQLVAAGINAVLDARAEFDDAPLFTADPSILYCWNPTQDDGQHKPATYWDKTLAFSLPLLAKPNTKLLFHCAAGVNRGPSNLACVLMALGLSSDAAAQMIKAARPIAQIGYLADAAAAVTSLGY